MNIPRACQHLTRTAGRFPGSDLPTKNLLSTRLARTIASAKLEAMDTPDALMEVTRQLVWESRMRAGAGQRSNSRIMERLDETRTRIENSLVALRRTYELLLCLGQVYAGPIESAPREEAAGAVERDEVERVQLRAV